MSAYDEAANCAWSDYRKDYGVSNHEPIRTREHKAFHAGWEAAKAERSRDYYLVPLADLPPVEAIEGDVVVCGGIGFRVGSNPGAQAVKLRRFAHRHLAVAAILEARESEAAVLAHRRDELARELTLDAEGFSHPYEDIPDKLRMLLDRTLDAEDRAQSAEAEVARLKEES